MRVPDLTSLLATIVLLMTPAATMAATAGSRSNDSETPEQLVHALYDLVTFPGGTTPDWDVARKMFMEDALVVLRTGREATTVFTVEGWIDDFVTFIQNSVAKEQGFRETILTTRTVQMGDIANVWVLYEAQLPGRPARKGVDNFSLIRKDGRWLIVSILNELPLGGVSVPDVLVDH